MRVLISGVGVAGPALAFFLAKIGAEITLVEKAPVLLAHGQNVDITGSARTVVKKMGLMDQVRKYNTTEKGTVFIDSKGRPFAPFPIRGGTTASFTSEFEILRADLAKVLHNATKDHPNVKTLFGTTIKNVVSNDDNAVKVELSNGEVQEFDLLVAADGQWSKVRKQCFPAESVNVVDKNMYAVYWTIPREAGDNDWWNVFQALKSRIITTRPDPHGTIRAMFTFVPRTNEQKDAWQKASRSDKLTQEKLLRQEFAGAGWQADRLMNEIASAPDFYFQDLKQIKMSQWSTSRVICLGDAAYAPTPLTGMGTSLAISGAYVLAGELSKLQPGEHPSKALDAYENEFRPFVEETQKVPSIFPRIAHPVKSWQRWILSTFLRILSRVVRLPFLKNRSQQINNEDYKLPIYAKFENTPEK